MTLSGSTFSMSKTATESGVRWGWLLALGILMIVLGVIGLGMAYRLTIVAVFWFGVLTVVGGVAQIIDAFHHKGWKGIAWHLIIGVVYVLAGLVLILTPVSAAFWLTLFLAVSFVVTGIARIVMAFRIRQQAPGWVLILFSGLISIALGVMVYGTIRLPSPEALATAEGQLAWIRSWGWVIGLMVAIELIMEGVALLSVALAARASTNASKA